jgi:hypothetical protein
MKAIVKQESASIQGDMPCSECMSRWNAVGCHAPCARCQRWKVLKGEQDKQKKD